MSHICVYAYRFKVKGLFSSVILRSMLHFTLKNIELFMLFYVWWHIKFLWQNT